MTTRRKVRGYWTDVKRVVGGEVKQPRATRRRVGAIATGPKRKGIRAVSDCQECAKLRAENSKLKEKIKTLSGSQVPPVRGPSHDMYMPYDIARRMLPPPKPRGPQC